LRKNTYEQQNNWRDDFVPLDELSEYDESYCEACESGAEQEYLDGYDSSSDKRRLHIAWTKTSFYRTQVLDQRTIQQRLRDGE